MMVREARSARSIIWFYKLVLDEIAISHSGEIIIILKIQMHLLFIILFTY